MLCATCTVLSLGRVLIALQPHAPLFVILEPVPTSILELTTVGHGLDPIHARQGILIDLLPFAETTNDFDVSPEVRSQVIVNLGPSRLKPRLRHLRTAKAPLRASALLLALLKPALEQMQLLPLPMAAARSSPLPRMRGKDGCQATC